MMKVKQTKEEAKEWCTTENDFVAKEDESLDRNHVDKGLTLFSISSMTTQRQNENVDSPKCKSDQETGNRKTNIHAQEDQLQANSF